MGEIPRTIKLVTTQAILSNVAPIEEGFPMREWSIKIYILGPRGEELPASVYDKVTYHLHPTFQNPTRHLKKPPFTLTERGWGEFDMEIVLNMVDKAGQHTIKHDLHFQKPSYDSTHKLKFPTSSTKLVKLLAASGTVPGEGSATEEANGAKRGPDKRKQETDTRVKKRSRPGVSDEPDLEKLADALQKLQEEDLLQIVQMVHDNKGPDTYYKNDVDQGEFHVDLYTIPDNLAKMMWSFVSARVEL